MVPEDHNFQRESQILVRPEGGCQVSLNPSNNGFKQCSCTLVLQLILEDHLFLYILLLNIIKLAQKGAGL